MALRRVRHMDSKEKATKALDMFIKECPPREAIEAWLRTRTEEEVILLATEALTAAANLWWVQNRG